MRVVVACGLRPPCSAYFAIDQCLQVALLKDEGSSVTLSGVGGFFFQGGSSLLGGKIGEYRIVFNKNCRVFCRVLSIYQACFSVLSKTGINIIKGKTGKVFLPATASCYIRPMHRSL